MRIARHSNAGNESSYSKWSMDNPGLKTGDRVRFAFDVNYVYSLPKWVLEKPRIK